MFYPVKAGSYTPVLFISGLYGSVYPSFYSTAISNLASYGYVVASIDPYWPAAGVAGWRAREEGRGRDTWRLRLSQEEIKNNAERSFQLLQWVRRSGTLYTVTPPNKGHHAGHHADNYCLLFWG